MKTLRELAVMKKRWSRAVLKNGEDRRQRALDRIDTEIARRQGKPVRCALPKKQQRKLGLLPAVGSTN